MCSIYGDPHYTTYDGNRYMFEGHCEYVISEDHCHSAEGTFRIQSENVACGSTGKVIITVDLIFFDREISWIKIWCQCGIT